MPNLILVMNASNITHAKNDITLYKAYYDPIIFPGITNTGVSTFVRSTIMYNPYSSVSSSGTITSSFTSSVNTHYLYECNGPYTSYQLANDVKIGREICTGTLETYLAWKGVRPNVNNSAYHQGTNFQNGCSLCSLFGSGSAVCCTECA